MIFIYRKLCNCSWLRSAIFQNRHDVIFSAEDGPICMANISETGAELKSKPDVEFQYDGRLGEFNGLTSHSHLPHCRVLPAGEFNSMSFQSYISHCSVLPLGELTVTIPEPHATLQGAVTWRNQCHDRATLQGVIVPSAILKIVFAILYIFCFNAV